jgi:hypothetical protein
MGPKPKSETLVNHGESLGFSFENQNSMYSPFFRDTKGTKIHGSMSFHLIGSSSSVPKLLAVFLWEWLETGVWFGTG